MFRDQIQHYSFPPASASITLASPTPFDPLTSTVSPGASIVASRSRAVAASATWTNSRRPSSAFARLAIASPTSSTNWADRKSGVAGKSVSVRVDLGGRRIIKKKKANKYAKVLMSSENKQTSSLASLEQKEKKN